MKLGNPLTPLRYRFLLNEPWSKEAMLSMTVRDGDCLLFGIHRKTPVRYVSMWAPGIAGDGNKGDWLAHRLMYVFHTGEDISGKAIHHTCAQTQCINPEHLQLASYAENNLEMLARRDYEAEIARLNDRVTELEAQLK
jgi:hypothetical protein